MDDAVAKSRIEQAIYNLSRDESKMKRREDYVHGEQALPFAPDGVNDEYLSLRKQSQANWTGLAVFSPIQRLKCESVRTGLGKKTDDEVWKNIWQANRMDSRQTIIYEQMMTHGRGIGSVWVNPNDKSKPIMRPQSPRNVWLEPDPEDPFRTEWVVKLMLRPTDAPNSLILPAGTRNSKTIAVVYDSSEWAKYSQENGGEWEKVDGGGHPFGEPPFVSYEYRPDANARVWSPVDPLIPQQDAINTIRFNMLLAMQYSAYRQRIVTGFDPVARDAAGQILWQKDADGTYTTDKHGRRIPVLNEFGRASVDRMLVFNGNDTKVFDMPESNLANYVTMLTEFLTQFFATAQVPPQYLLSRMANLSGDAIAGAESTLTSLQGELKRYASDGHMNMIRLARKASGKKEPEYDMEMLYADTEVKSFAQIVDGIQKLITGGFSRRAAWEMIPGASQSKVDRWMELAEQEARDSLLAMVKEGIGFGEFDPSELGSSALQPTASDLSGSAATN